MTSNDTHNPLPELPTGESLEQELKGPDFLRDDEWFGIDIEGSILDLDDALVTPEYTIEVNGAKMGPVTGVQTIAGQSGHGKTQTMTLLMSTYLGANMEALQLIWKRPQPSVLYVDTEMEKGNTQLVVARVARICDTGISQLKERLRVMRLRDEEDHAMIWRKILKAVWQLKPDVLFLDGMIDIIGDFNDNREANTIIRKVMKVADHYEIPIWAVMHQNPGTTKMAGHQGSFLERKSTVVLSPVKVCDDEQRGIYHFDIKNGKQRGEDVRPLSFHMERFALPNGETNAYPVLGKSINEGVAQPVQEQVDVMRLSKDDRFQFFALAIGKDRITTRDIREDVKNEFHIGATKADAFIAESERMGIITRGTDKRYSLADGQAQDKDLPF